jgi:UDP-glucose 4-epimerase
MNAVPERVNLIAFRGSNSIVILGTGTETSVRDLAETVQQATDTDSAIVHTNPRLADIDHSVAAIAKARERLGYEPRVSLREGIESPTACGD